MSDAISRSAESEIYPIDGEALFNAVQSLKRYDIRRNMFDEIAFMHVFKDQDVLNAILSAECLDVVPVVHARWVDGTTRIGLWIKCSSCGIEQTERDAYGYKHSFNFCPNCGARMDGEDNG